MENKQPQEMEKPQAELVACPNCGSSEHLYEQGWRPTFQQVTGLKRDGDADDYESFDYGDDVIVDGYSCRNCDWFDASGISNAEQERIGKEVERVLTSMKAV